MAVIRFTEADKLATKTIAAGLYPSEVSLIDGPKKSSSAKSVNYFIDISVTEGPFKGKTRTIVFNTETNSPSLLGDMQFFPVAYMMLLAGAALGREIGAEAIDTDTILHKPFEAAWGTTTVEGRLINIILDFHPVGYSKEAPAF